MAPVYSAVWSVQRLVNELGASPWRPPPAAGLGTEQVQAAALCLAMAAPREAEGSSMHERDQAACMWLMRRTAAVVALQPALGARHGAGALLQSVRRAMRCVNPGLPAARLCRVDTLPPAAMDGVGWEQYFRREARRRERDRQRFARWLGASDAPLAAVVDGSLPLSGGGWQQVVEIGLCFD